MCALPSSQLLHALIGGGLKHQSPHLFCVLCELAQGGKNPLLWAAHNGHAPVVKALLESGADIGAEDEKEVRDTCGLERSQTPCCCVFTVLLRSFSCAPTALKHCSVAISRLPQDGKTALLYAAERGRLEVVKTLHAGGADIEAMDKVRLCGGALHTLGTYQPAGEILSAALTPSPPSVRRMP